MRTESDAHRPRVGIVGPCTSGKSTLIASLRSGYPQARQFELRHIAQEHSYVQTMWERIGKPDLLVFLDVSFRVTLERNPRLNWTEAEYQEQQRRLSHARSHAHLVVDTDGLLPVQVAEKVLEFLETTG